MIEISSEYFDSVCNTDLATVFDRTNHILPSESTNKMWHFWTEAWVDNKNRLRT